MLSIWFSFYSTVTPNYKIFLMFFFLFDSHILEVAKLIQRFWKKYWYLLIFCLLFSPWQMYNCVINIRSIRELGRLKLVTPSLHKNNLGFFNTIQKVISFSNSFKKKFLNYISLKAEWYRERLDHAVFWVGYTVGRPTTVN